MNHSVNQSTSLVLKFFVVVSLSLLGCRDSSVAPVSGKVTLGGDPVDGVRLVFSPKLNDDGKSPGPWSSGVTNSDGEYSLKTRHKKNGAVVGKHVVAFVYDDGDDLSIFKERLREAKQERDQEAIAAAETRIADFKELQKSRAKVPKDLSLIHISEPTRPY